LRFSIQFGFFVIVYIIYYFTDPTCQAHLTWYALLAPVMVFMLAGLALGFGTIISSMTTKYRDLQILFSFLVSLWMYATPVVYPMTQIRDPRLITLIRLNPVTQALETFRHILLGTGEISTFWWIITALITVLVLTGGVLLFNKVEKTFMDTV
jgi:lipopolysaccharide transport system permease protein